MDFKKMKSLKKEEIRESTGMREIERTSQTESEYQMYQDELQQSETKMEGPTSPDELYILPPETLRAINALENMAKKQKSKRMKTIISEYNSSHDLETFIRKLCWYIGTTKREKMYDIAAPIVGSLFRFSMIDHPEIMATLSFKVMDEQKNVKDKKLKKSLEKYNSYFFDILIGCRQRYAKNLDDYNREVELHQKYRDKSIEVEKIRQRKEEIKKMSLGKPEASLKKKEPVTTMREYIPDDSDDMMEYMPEEPERIMREYFPEESEKTMKEYKPKESEKTMKELVREESEEIVKKSENKENDDEFKNIENELKEIGAKEANDAFKESDDLLFEKDLEEIKKDENRIVFDKTEREESKKILEEIEKEESKEKTDNIDDEEIVIHFEEVERREAIKKIEKEAGKTGLEAIKEVEAEKEAEKEAEEEVEEVQKKTKIEEGEINTDTVKKTKIIEEEINTDTVKKTKIIEEEINTDTVKKTKIEEGEINTDTVKKSELEEEEFEEEPERIHAPEKKEVRRKLKEPTPYKGNYKATPELKAAMHDLQIEADDKDSTRMRNIFYRQEVNRNTGEFIRDLSHYYYTTKNETLKASTARTLRLLLEYTVRDNPEIMAHFCSKLEDEEAEAKTDKKRYKEFQKYYQEFYDILNDYTTNMPVSSARYKEEMEAHRERKERISPTDVHMSINMDSITSFDSEFERNYGELKNVIPDSSRIKKFFKSGALGKLYSTKNNKTTAIDLRFQGNEQKKNLKIFKEAMVELAIYCATTKNEHTKELAANMLKSMKRFSNGYFILPTKRYDEEAVKNPYKRFGAGTLYDEFVGELKTLKVKKKDKEKVIKALAVEDGFKRTAFGTKYITHLRLINNGINDNMSQKEKDVYLTQMIALITRHRQISEKKDNSDLESAFKRTRKVWEPSYESLLKKIEEGHLDDLTYAERILKPYLSILDKACQANETASEKAYATVVKEINGEKKKDIDNGEHEKNMKDINDSVPVTLADDLTPEGFARFYMKADKILLVDSISKVKTYPLKGTELSKNQKTVEKKEEDYKLLIENEESVKLLSKEELAGETAEEKLQSFLELKFNLDLSKEENIIQLLPKIERAKNAMDEMAKVYWENPGLFYGRDKVKLEYSKKLFLLSNALSIAETTREIMKNPYYRTHSNDEIDCRYSEGRSEDEKRLIELMIMRNAAVSALLRVDLDGLFAGVKDKNDDEKWNKSLEKLRKAEMATAEAGKNTGYTGEEDDYYDVVMNLPKNQQDILLKMHYDLPGSIVSTKDNLFRHMTNVLKVQDLRKIMTLDEFKKMFADLCYTYKPTHKESDEKNRKGLLRMRKRRIEGLKAYAKLIHHSMMLIKDKFGDRLFHVTIDEKTDPKSGWGSAIVDGQAWEEFVYFAMHIPELKDNEVIKEIAKEFPFIRSVISKEQYLLDKYKNEGELSYAAVKAVSYSESMSIDDPEYEEFSSADVSTNRIYASLDLAKKAQPKAKA